jgi:predicted ArsR family transcriptional regulator
VESDARTRDRIAQQVLRRGPVTAADIAERLALTSSGVRRHLDQLQADGLVTTWEAGIPQRRGRGRPARSFVLTDRGHAAMSSDYDDLAAAALRHLARLGGPKAVRGFAEERVAELEQRHRRAVEAAGEDPAARAIALAEALTRDGFAATIRPAPSSGAPNGVQLCQGHCPVQGVAREFPELCEAETDAFSRLLGVRVQRLATLAHGEHVCTTHVAAHPASTRPGDHEPGQRGPEHHHFTERQPR